MSDRTSSGFPDIDGLSGAYVLNALSDDERQAFEARLAESDELRTEVTELNETVLLLAHAVEPVTPSAALRASVLDLIGSTPQLAPLASSEDRVAEDRFAEDRGAQDARGGEAKHAASVSAAQAREGELLQPIPLARQRWFMRPAALLVGAAAAAGLFFGGVGVANQLNPGTSVTQPSASGVEQILAAPDVKRASQEVSTGGKATVYWSNSLERSAVILTGVAALPQGKTYELWYVDSAGKAVSAGTVDADSNSVSHVLQGDLTPGATVAMTVEPAGGSSQPTTKPILAVTSA